jgi:lysozyme family protein
MSADILKDNARWILRRVLAFEGGIAQVEGETWVTYYGQTPKWLKQWGFEAPKNADEALDNYVAWLGKTRLLFLCTSADHLALAVIDWAIHHGHVGAIKLLQKLVGAPEDGVIGPRTRKKVEEYGLPRAALAAHYNTARIRAMADLIVKNPSKYLRYARNWMRRATDHIDRIADEEIG